MSVTNPSRHWIILIVLSLAACLMWIAFMYPHFSFLDLSVNRAQALKTAKAYIQEHYGLDPGRYLDATVFSGRRNSDLYLQKALGFREEVAFLKEHDVELFFWKVRFFKENEEEQFFVTVSAATGEVTSFSHHIPDTSQRTHYDRPQAKAKVVAFLKKTFDFDPDRYTLGTDLAHVTDNRTDYSFEWKKNGVSIPWNKTPEESGTARLLISATISGDEILSFTKNKLHIPRSFDRHMQRIHNTGKNLTVMFRFFFVALLTAAIFFVIIRRHHLILHRIKNPCIIAALFLFLCEIVLYVNGLEYILYEYPTTTSFLSYFWSFFATLLLNIFFSVFIFTMPFLAGESLFHEVFPQRRDNTLLHHIRSTFFSRRVSALIVTGYLAALIMLGLQAILFYIGERHLGVWTEYRWMNSFSASYFAFIPAFVIGLSASLTEETMFRLFGISFGKRILKNTMLAVILTSVIWGFGHSEYPVYPMWFRGVEVSCLGILLSVIFLKFGLIPVLVAHYLFDAFWCSANVLLGQSAPDVFYSALVVLFCPLVIAAAAFILNRSENERPMAWELSQHQRYNLELLKYYLSHHPPPDTEGREEEIRKIVEHGWDIAVVETAFNELDKK